MGKKKVKIEIGDLWKGKKDQVFLTKDDIVLVMDVINKYNTTNVLFHYIDEPDDRYEWEAGIFCDSFKKIS